MKDYLLKYISENLRTIKIFTGCLIIGILVGIIIFKLGGSETQDSFINYTKSALDLAKSDGFEGINILKNGIIFNIIISIIIYISSVTLIAPICICTLNVIKGISIGIYIPILFSIFGLGNGLLACLGLVILPNLIYIPVYIYMCTNSINLHYLITNRNTKENLFKELVKESYRFLISFSLIVLSIVIEQLTSFWIINMYI